MRRHLSKEDKMNKKGQAGPISTIIVVIITLLIMFLWLGSFIGTVTLQGTSEAGLTGVEAFFLNNLVIWVYVFMILGTMAFFYFQGQ